MTRQVTPSAVLIAHTTTLPAFRQLSESVGWSPEGAESEAGELIEFAGRACYESWEKPNPRTAVNPGYIDHLLEVGHYSVIEHANLTWYITGVSRSLTHELVRHRHFSYSQLSQRYVDPGEGASDTGMVVPPLLEGDAEGIKLLTQAVDTASHAYEELVAHLQERYPDSTRKEHRQTARALLPNATETRLVVTGNYRAHRHFFDMRCSPAADAEIRNLALLMLEQAQQVEPSVFGDYAIMQDEQGRRSVVSSLVTH